MVLTGFIYVNCFVSNEWKWKGSSCHAELIVWFVRAIQEYIIYSQKKTHFVLQSEVTGTKIMPEDERRVNIGCYGGKVNGSDG